MRLMISDPSARRRLGLDHIWRLSFRWVRCVAVLVIAAFGLFNQSAAASTVLRRSLSDLVKGAELVFEGTVTASVVVPGAGDGPPHTCITFAINDVIAGQSPGDSLQLCFLGGDVNGVQTVVTDLHYPVVGEHGIYLAESTHQPMVNPLIGWDQGRFLVEKDPVSGAAKVLTAHRRPVIGIAPAASLPTAATTLLSGQESAGGVSSGDGPDLAGAMSRDAFKAWLRAAR